MGAADVLIGIVPVILAVAFVLLIARSMGDRSTGMVDRMKQAVGGTVMLLVALMVVFAFTGGGDPGPGPDPDPDPDPDPELYDVHFYVATDSAGYGTVSISSLSDVPEGTSVTVAQTLTVGSAGQCTATPAAATSEYTYAFSGWTGADDASTPAPTSITADTHYYAHFSRTAVEPQPMDPSLFIYSTSGGINKVNGWAGTPPADGYDLMLPETDDQGNAIEAVAGWNGLASPWSGAASASSATIGIVAGSAFRECALLVTAEFPSATKVESGAFLDCTALKSIELPAVAEIQDNALTRCTAIERVTFGPLTTFSEYAAQSWTFYDTDGTTVLQQTAANLANSTFEGVYNALVKVDPNRGLTPEMEQRVLELSAENSLKASMLAELDPELADMDPSDVARMTVSEIESMTADDVRAIKSSLPPRSG